MRLFIMFDLPVKTKKDVQNYNKFRRKLLNLGFYMVQLSIYAKLCINHDEVAKNNEIINKNLPPKGNIRCLTVTEKQYEMMKVLIGTKSYQEEITTNKYLIEL
ncbi:CRISPR-associated endoribonuclease Cas2 [Spiroplasma sp. JKS002669]|nr:CRISPR-associated endoribonuclease Cas2 [Spiroplasma sp. JKS002669]MCL8210163.1 CRISPR-associated endoribonuclease Cas2 [Spiroplasma sp. JKS002670]MCL8210671.1 CRISPR-associated endoribonuclease Cas2 [Spiroplasma sp. JKS002671]